ncbi:MAG: hypothetical protein QXT86_11250 [Archaeoglobaceae archaeon]
MMLPIFFVIIFIVFTASFTAKAFMIQTSPPPVIKNFACDCSQIVSCVCKLGDVTATVILNTRNWQRYADKSLFGSKICSSRCIASIGQVVRVSVPFLSLQTLEKAEKTALATKRKTIGRTEKMSANVAPGAPGVGAGYATEETRGVTKERSLSYLKSQAKSQNVDLTTYFILEFTKFRKGNATVENVFDVLEELTLANARGELEKYLAAFFIK